MSFFRLLRKTQGREPGRTPGKVQTLPAPVGGWNARDALQAMKPEDAIILDNVIPDLGRVRLRPGFDVHATGIAGSYVESMMEYAPKGGTNKMFSAGPTAIYETTSAGAVGAAVVSSLSNGRWQHTMFSTIASTYLVIANGADSVRHYDGTTWATPSITGATSSTFVHVTAHAGRLWFVQKDSLSLWYLGAGSIAGAATELNLGAVFKLGGAIQAAGSWTVDGGDGMDDKLVVVTTKGEVAVYQGIDPDNANDFGLVGVFKIPEPVGRRCLIKVGADMGVITSTGVALLSSLLGVNASGQKAKQITNKIGGAFKDAYAEAGSNHGWQIFEFPKMGLVLINVPITERGETHQYVVNTETGAWCRFTGINANAWSLLGDDLYFGASDGKTYKFGEALSDNGSPISATIMTAYNKFRSPLNKTVQAVRPLLFASPGFSPGIEIKTDFETSAITVTAPSSPALVGAVWDVALWDVALWGSDVVKRRTWKSVAGSGVAVSVVLVCSGQDVVFEFNEIDVMYQEGTWL